MPDIKHFELLNAINVNEKTEKKEAQKGKYLTYLSWSWAWQYIKSKYPDATYTIWKNEKGLPFAYDESTGYMVYTTVTIEGITHEMWLPVMDSKNRAMKSKPYEYTTSYGTKTVEPATMTDINKTIMRCLTKNLAMFGLGLYIYAGEDIPEDEKQEKTFTKNEKISYANEKVEFLEYINSNGYTDEQIDAICKHYKVATLEDLQPEHISDYMKQLKAKKGGK